MTNLFFDTISYETITTSTLASLQYTKFAMFVIPSFMAILPGLVALCMGCFMHLVDFLKSKTEEEYESYQQMVEKKTLAKDIMRPVGALPPAVPITVVVEEEPEYESNYVVEMQKAPAMSTKQGGYSQPQMLPDVDGREDLFVYLVAKTIDFSVGEMLPA